MSSSPISKGLALSPGPALVAGIGLTIGVCAADYLTGAELSFSIFYFLPIVLVTWCAGRGLGLVVASLSGGAWLVAEALGGMAYSADWILAFNTLTRLGVFVILVLILSSLQNALRAASELARVDSLTGLSNSRAFHEATEREIFRARRQSEALSVIYVDVDNFKAVNDQFGHSAGDALLVRIGQCLGQELRATDVAARLGGDEFAVLLPSAGVEAAQQVVAKLDRALASIPAQTSYPIGFSIGVACFDTPPESADAMLHEADALMYEVKRAGKGEVRLASR